MAPPPHLTTITPSPAGSTVVIAGLTSGGDLGIYYAALAAPTDTLLNTPWIFQDISTLHLQPQGLTTPTFTSNLTSFGTSWGQMVVGGLDDSGHVQAIWWSPDLGEHWTLTDLSQAAAGPSGPAHPSGRISSFVTPWHALNVVATDDAGDTTAVWWSPELGADWATTDLTTVSGGPRLAAPTVDSLIAPWSAMHILGLDATTGRVPAYWS